MSKISVLLTSFKYWYWIVSPFSGFVTEAIPEVTTKQRRKWKGATKECGIFQKRK